MAARRSELVGGRVLVTGATGGIGHAIARAFAARGASLLLTGRRAEPLEALAAETGGRALAADLSDPADVARLAGEAGEVDVFVSNAALPGSGDVGEYTDAQLDRALAVNLRAPMVLARDLGAAMRRRGRGHMVFVGSAAGKAAMTGVAVYAATKFGLRGFAIALRDDLRGEGVGVSAVVPGFIGDAGMYADSGVELPSWVGTKSSEEVAAAVIHAVERDRGEIDVMPASMRVSTAFACLAPEFANRAGRRLGSARIARDFGEAQRDKR